MTLERALQIGTVLHERWSWNGWCSEIVPYTTVTLDVLIRLFFIPGAW